MNELRKLGILYKNFKFSKIIKYFLKDYLKRFWNIFKSVLTKI